MSQKHIIIAYTDTGGGHKATALALKTELEQTHGHKVSLVNVYQDIIAEFDIIRRYSPYNGEQIYNDFVLGKGWSGLFCLAFYGTVMLNIRLFMRQGVANMEAYWREHRPDLVISVMPLLNQALRASLQKQSIPFMVVLTDFCEPQKYVWFPRGDDYDIACGTEAAYQATLNKPHAAEKILQTSGLIVHPKFYAPACSNIAEERESLGLNPDLTTGCMLYGGMGSWHMLELAQALANLETTTPIQMIFLCGHNQALASALADLSLPYPHFICGYTQRVPYFMQLADFFIGKPGPGSVSEALLMGLPLLLDRKNLLLQEKYNLTWVKQHQVGFDFNGVREFRKVAQQFLMPETLRKLQQQVSQLPKNRALFEVTPLIERLLN